MSANIVCFHAEIRKMSVIFIEKKNTFELCDNLVSDILFCR